MPTNIGLSILIDSIERIEISRTFRMSKFIASKFHLTMAEIVPVSTK